MYYKYLISNVVKGGKNDRNGFFYCMYYNNDSMSNRPKIPKKTFYILPGI